MRGAIIRLSVAAAVGAGVFATALRLGTHVRALALAAYLFFLLALGLIGLIAWLRQAMPVVSSLYGSGGGRQQPAPQSLRQVRWIERNLRAARQSAFDLRIRFRPLVRQIAAVALARRYGIVLEREPERAREVMSERLWRLLEEEQEPPENRFARGLSSDELRALIEDLEAI
jgi:hypothetical protein